MLKLKGFDGVTEFFDDDSEVNYELLFDYSLDITNEKLVLDHWEAHIYGQDKETLIEDADLSFRMQTAVEEELEKLAEDIDWVDEKYLAEADDE